MRPTAALLLAVVAFPATASANLLLNGDFELPGGAPVRQQIFANTVTDWTGGGTGFEIYESNGQDGINAESGTHYVSWGHNGTTGGTLSQTFTTVVGQQYTVSYFVTEQQGVDFTQQVTVEAFNGLTLLNSVAQQMTMLDGVWVAGNALSFTAASTSTTLTFLDTTPQGAGISANWGLDNVSVDPVALPAPATSPEPASLAVLGTGLAGLGVLLRRRSTR